MLSSQHQQKSSYFGMLLTLGGNYYYPLINPDDSSDLGQGVYIAQDNAELLPKILEKDHKMLSVLIVPFLAGSLGHYELLDYETNIEISEGSTYVMSYNVNNCLPEEVVSKLTPALRVNSRDFTTYINYLKNYFAQMRTMEFKHDMVAREIFLEHKKVYYEFY